MTARTAILWPRMRSVWPLLISVLISTLIAASLIAAFAGFSAAALPQAVSSELRSSPHRSITVSGAIDSALERTDQGVVSASIRRAFGGVPYSSAGAIWSDPIGLPAPRGGDPRASKTVTLVQAAAMSQIRTQVKLTSGTWPTAGVGTFSQNPVQAVVPVAAAAALRLSVGQVLVLRDRLTGAKVRFDVTGLYRPLNTSAPYWSLDLISPGGVSEQPGFITYGPFIIGHAAFADGQVVVGGATWLYQLGTTRLAASQLRPLGARIDNAVGYLTGSQTLGGLQAASALPGVLAVIATKLVVARSLLLVGELELLLLCGAALTLTARTLASQREEESAIFSARGAGRRQLLTLALSEALIVTALGAAAGVGLGSRLAGLLARIGPLRAAGLRITGIPASEWQTAAAVLLLCTVVMIWPALHTMAPGVARARKGRGAAVAMVTSAGADLALVVLAVLAGWQLRQFSVLGRTSASLGVDPVLVAAPAIALAAGTVLPLRLLPLLARAGDRLAARTRRLGGAMTTWELSRRATRQSAPMLLIVLAVGTSTLALAQHQSWRQSALDQSAFAAGADVRADTLYPATIRSAGVVAHAPGVKAAMAVSTALAPPGSGEVLAIDASQAPATALLSGGESSSALWREIAPPRTPAFITLPGRPRRLEIIASMAQGHGPDLGPIPVTVSVQDAAGILYQISAGTLPADGQPHALVADLTSSGQAIYPLRLLAITAGYTLPLVPPAADQAASAARVAVFAVSGLAASPARTGPIAGRLPAASLLARWTPGVTAQALATSGAGTPPKLIAGRGTGSAPVRFYPGDGVIPALYPGLPAFPIVGQVTLEAPVTGTAIPAIATQAFLSGNHLQVGALLQVTAGQTPITVRIVTAVSSFPTISSASGGLIVDQAAVAEVVAALGQPPFAVTQWWLATRAGEVPSGLPPHTAITDRARLATALLGDPMSAIPQQAIQATAIAAALLAVLGFSVSVVGSVRERRSQAALLAALGVGGAAQARLLSLEALTLSAPAAATGLLLGALLAYLLVPAVTLTATAAAPAVPVLVQVPVGAAIAFALIVAAIPVAAAAASAIYRPDPAVALRASEAA
jgi:hypothetical protein